MYSCQHIQRPQTQIYIHEFYYLHIECQVYFSDNKIKSTFLCVLSFGTRKLTKQALWYVIVMCIIWLHTAFVNTLIEILNRHSSGEAVLFTNFSDFTAVDCNTRFAWTRNKKVRHPAMTHPSNTATLFWLISLMWIWWSQLKETSCKTLICLWMVLECLGTREEICYCSVHILLLQKMSFKMGSRNARGLLNGQWWNTWPCYMSSAN